VSLSAERTTKPNTQLRTLREENQTLYSVIRLVSSSLELSPMLQGVVDLATEATGCHACFIYLLEGDRLTIRAASPVFAEAVDNVQMGLDEGLTGWVARHRTPEFIRDRAMSDPRMKYIPQLQEGGAELALLAGDPEIDAPSTVSPAGLLLAALDGGAANPAVRSLWPELDVADLLVVSLTAGGERVGLLCAGAPARQAFSNEDTEVARAIAHFAAIAIKRAELIEGLTNASIVKDLFEALAAGATSFASAKAAEVRCDLSAPYLLVCAEPAGGRERASGEWRESAEELGRGLSALAPDAAVDAGPGPVRALLALGSGRAQPVEQLLRECRELGEAGGAAIGISELHEGPADATRAYREAQDAATIGRALLGDGGAIAYSQVGAYRYLVHIAAEDAPHDRMRQAVDRLIEYDRRRRTALLDTLERYLAERRSVIESARALFIHPNTLRQRLGRIEELTGLRLDEDDLLSLELAIKLARLHGRP
jgi:hypothetical protein